MQHLSEEALCVELAVARAELAAARSTVERLVAERARLRDEVEAQLERCATEVATARADAEAELQRLRAYYQAGRALGSALRELDPAHSSSGQALFPGQYGLGTESEKNHAKRRRTRGPGQEVSRDGIERLSGSGESE